MHRHTLLRSALKRTLKVAILACSTLMVVTGTSLAAPDPEAAATPASHALTIAGMSVMTLAWVVVGIAFLAGGLVAASKSGKHPAVARRGSTIANSAASDQSDVNQAALAA